MKHVKLALIVMMLFALQTMMAAGESREWTIDNLPMVHLQDASRYLVNPDGLVSPAIQDSCDRYMQAMEKNKGIQTVFVVVKHLKGADDLAETSSRLGDKYGVGDKKTSRGLVIIISADDHRWFIAPGSGLQGDYPDITARNIGMACIVPNMRKGDVNAAVLSTCKAFYSGKLDDYYDDNDEGSPAQAIWLTIIIIVIVYILFHRGGGGFFFFGGPPFFGGGGSFGGGSGGGSFGGGSFNGGGAGGDW